MVEVRLSRRAVKDLDAITAAQSRRVLDALDDPEDDAFDVKALVGRRPWRRLRVGNYRVLFRLSGDVLLVAPVIHRSELERAVRTLPD